MYQAFSLRNTPTRNYNLRSMRGGGFRGYVCSSKPGSSTRACSVSYNYAWEYFRREKAWYILSRDACRDLRSYVYPWRQPFYLVSNRRIPLSSCYRKHEQTKKRMYEQRCREVEHASFTPLVISATGGLAKEATVFYKRLASMLASKWDTPYTVLVTMPTHLFTATLCNSVHQGS